MQDTRLPRLVAAILASLLLLTACGGASLKLSPSTLTFSATSDYAQPDMQKIVASIAHGTTGGLFLKTEVSGDAVEWVSPFSLNVATSKLEAQVRVPLAFSLGPGTHHATITITACDSGPACTTGIIGKPETIRVSYTITYAQLNPVPTRVDFNLHTYSNSEYDVTRTLDYAANAPWSITSALPGVSVSPSSGNTTRGQLTITLDRTAAAAMPIGLTTSHLTFNSAGNQPLEVPLTVFIRRPRAFYAAPRVQLSGGSGDVRTWVRGSELWFPTGFLGVRYGQVPETMGFSFNSTRFESLRPPLPAGTYKLQLLDAAGADVAQPTLQIIVVDPLPLPAAAIPYPNDGRSRRVSDLFFDAETNALVLGIQYPGGSESDSEILRYQWNGSWPAPSVRSQPYLASLVPRVDGGWLATALVNGGNDDALVSCNQDFTACENKQVTPAAIMRRTTLGMTNDGLPLVVSRPRNDPAGPASIQQYSLHEDTFLPLRENLVLDAIAVTSDDGTRVAIGNRVTTAGSGPQVVLVWNSLTPNLGGFQVPSAVNRLAIDGSGSRIIVNGNQVHENSVGALFGTLPATTLAAALNRNGTRAFAWDENGTVRIFDVQAQPVPLGSPLAEVAPAIVPAADPGAGINGQDMRMAVSPDGGTLFMAGSDGIVVVPVSGT